jgi:hypothetical protein
MPATDTETTEIAMRVKLSKAAKEKLTARAAESGLAIDDYASELLEQVITQSAIDELLAPVRAELAESGMSEDEIMELGRRELEALRRERKDRSK